MILHLGRSMQHFYFIVLLIGFSCKSPSPYESYINETEYNDELATHNEKAYVLFYQNGKEVVNVPRDGKLKPVVLRYMAGIKKPVNGQHFVDIKATSNLFVNDSNIFTVNIRFGTPTLFIAKDSLYLRTKVHSDIRIGRIVDNLDKVEFVDGVDIHLINRRIDYNLFEEWNGDKDLSKFEIWILVDPKKSYDEYPDPPTP